MASIEKTIVMAILSASFAALKLVGKSSGLAARAPPTV
jgi:hypothetical protein